MTPAEERALAWARGILADAMEYPRAGDGWPHYSADEAQADIIIRAAGLAWMLPESVTETAEQRSEREASARARAAEIDRYLAEQEARRQREQEEEAALEAEARRAQFEQSLPASMRAYGPAVDCAGRRVAAVHWYHHIRRAEYCEVRNEDGRVLQRGEVVVNPLDSRERIVQGQGMTLVTTTATSDWLPVSVGPRAYGGDEHEAERAWEQWDPYARERAAKAAAKAAKRAAAAPAAPASPFAALAALK